MQRFIIVAAVAAILVILFSHWLIIGAFALGGYSVGRLHGGYKAKRQLKQKHSKTLTEADWSA